MSRLEQLVTDPQIIVESGAIAPYLAVNHASHGTGVMTSAKQSKIDRQIKTIQDYMANHMNDTPPQQNRCTWVLDDGTVCGQDHTRKNHTRSYRGSQERLAQRSREKGE